MKVLGLGNALTDVLAILSSDECIHEVGLFKGGMQLINEDKLLKIMAMFEDFDTFLATGGSAANAVSGLTRMGVPGGFIGKVGHDSYGRFYKEDLRKNGVEPYLLSSDIASGCAMTMITPDGERTFGTYLGAAATLSQEDLHPAMFEGYDLLHIEGYLVQDPLMIRRAVQLAQDAGLKISLDMSSYNIVKENLDFFEELLVRYVNIVFANEEEAYAYTGLEPEDAVKILAKQCEIAVVKCGAQGSVICRGEEVAHVSATRSKCVDTTGAGDLYAAGFLYGLSCGYSLEIAGNIGSILSGEVIEVIGTKMDDARWAEIKLKVQALFNN
ncbi:adenosine kinase [Coprobacter tertius]|uniref:Adenosine kinase n=1 Tax=Coprobacter tertius TaxID=2944915 RepID=A0ABT1MJ70_9BACT|nr:adenosine kinase [Coprobacter tertius]MCP9612466.1 adenosine kinase [Coprobacter tertius]